MDPQQEIFTEMLTALRNAGETVYDGYLPPEGVPYPFIYMGESQQFDTANKTATFGEVVQTFHVYHNNPKNRGEVSGKLLKIKQIANDMKHSANFAWWATGVNQQIMPDNTTDKPLIHGVLDITFRFS